MTLAQIITTAFFFAWMGVIAWLLWRGQRMQQTMQQSLLELAARAHESARASALALDKLMTFVEETRKQGEHGLPE